MKGRVTKEWWCQRGENVAQLGWMPFCKCQFIHSSSPYVGKMNGMNVDSTFFWEIPSAELHEKWMNVHSSFGKSLLLGFQPAHWKCLSLLIHLLLGQKIWNKRQWAELDFSVSSTTPSEQQLLPGLWEGSLEALPAFWPSPPSTWASGTPLFELAFKTGKRTSPYLEYNWLVGFNYPLVLLYVITLICVMCIMCSLFTCIPCVK